MHFRQPLKALLVTGTALALALPAVAAGSADRPLLQLSQATPTGQQDRAGQAAPADRAATEVRRGQQARAAAGQPFDIITQSRALRAMPVVNGKGERLGQIYDIIVSTQNRSVLYALLAAPAATATPATQSASDTRERAADAAERPSAAGRERLYPIPFGTLRIADRSEMRVAGAAAAPRPADERPADAKRGDGEPRRLVDLTVDDIDGMSVVNGWGEGIADVEEVIRGPNDVPMAVLGVGGFLGMGEKYIAVSLSELQYDSTEDNLVTGMSRDEVEQAPSIEYSDADEIDDDVVVGTLLSAAGLVPGMDERGELRNKVLVLDVEQEQLANAPSFDRGEFPNLADRRWHDSIVAFYTKLFETSATPVPARDG